MLGVCVWSHGGGWSVGYVLSPFPFLLMYLLSPITTNFPPSGLRKTLLQLPYITYHPSPSDAMDASSPGRAVYSVTAEYGPAALGATPGYYWLFTIKHC